MDLRLGAATPATDAGRAAVARVGPPGSGWEGGERTAADGHAALAATPPAPGGICCCRCCTRSRNRSADQSRSARPCLRQAHHRAGEAYGVASFYALFRTSPSPSAVVHVCDDLACQVNGAEQICEQMESRFGAEGASPGSTAPVSPGSAVPSGPVDRGSAAMIQHAGADPGRVVLAPFGPDEVRWPSRPRVWPGRQPARLAGRRRPLPAAPATAGGAAGSGLNRFLPGRGRIRDAAPGRVAGPQGGIRELQDAKLLGRGGAAFPTAGSGSGGH